MENLEKRRKSRSDKSKPRQKYDSTLPKEYKSYLSRANNKGVRFDISIEDFYAIANKDCVYCGSEGLNGISRINSKSFYTKDNLVACCTKCNLMKFTYSRGEFLKHINKIYAFQYLKID